MENIDEYKSTTTVETTSNTKQNEKIINDTTKEVKRKPKSYHKSTNITFHKSNEANLNENLKTILNTKATGSPNNVHWNNNSNQKPSQKFQQGLPKQAATFKANKRCNNNSYTLFNKSDNRIRPRYNEFQNRNSSVAIESMQTSSNNKYLHVHNDDILPFKNNIKIHPFRS